MKFKKKSQTKTNSSAEKNNRVPRVMVKKSVKELIRNVVSSS